MRIIIFVNSVPRKTARVSTLERTEVENRVRLLLLVSLAAHHLVYYYHI